MTALSDADRRILAALSESGGSLTGQISPDCRIFRMLNRRMESAWVRNHLLDLERGGLVRRLDDQKPVCWTRTLAGTAAMEEKS